MLTVTGSTLALADEPGFASLDVVGLAIDSSRDNL
jgi:hypothetical protein